MRRRGLISNAVLPWKPRAKGSPAAAQGYRFAARGRDAAEFFIYGPIGFSWAGDGVTADQFRKDLRAAGEVKTIDVRISSEGGDVFEAQAIYSLLAQHKATVTVHIDGFAASAASFIAMAGNRIRIAEAGFVMIHNASAGVWGRAADLRQMADVLDQVDAALVGIYEARTRQAADDIRQWMAEETWMKGAEAVERGFADEMVENVKVAASLADPSIYRHAPSALFPRRARAAAELAAFKARGA